jgi:hypothetical protein
MGSARRFASRCWRLLGCRDVRISISEPLADDAFHSAIRTGFIVHATRHSMWLAKVNFRPDSGADAFRCNADKRCTDRCRVRVARTCRE